MRTQLRWITLALATFAAWPGMVRAASPPAREVAAEIDRSFHETWKADGVVSAADADDSVFLRRLTLDLAGRIPTVHEIRTFHACDVAGRRQQAIDRLLAGPGYARHWAVVWRRHFLPQADTPKYASFGPGFEDWLLDELTANTAFDGMCRAMLTTPPPDIAGQQAPPRSFMSVAPDPESLAGNSTRVFLGINLDCAQCHDHPHSRWSRNQFWEFAAFFTSPRPATDVLPVRWELQIPGTTTAVQARLFNQGELDRFQWLNAAHSAHSRSSPIDNGIDMAHAGGGNGHGMGRGLAIALDRPG